MEWKRLKDLQLKSPGETPHSLCCIQVCQNKNKKVALIDKRKAQRKQHKLHSDVAPVPPPFTPIYIQWLCPGWSNDCKKKRMIKVTKVLPKQNRETSFLIAETQTRFRSYLKALCSRSPFGTAVKWHLRLTADACPLLCGLSRYRECCFFQLKHPQFRL